MQYFAERSGIDDDLRCSGEDRAKDVVRRHILNAYPNGRACGEAYILSADGKRTPYYRSWIGPGLTIENATAARSPKRT